MVKWLQYARLPVFILGLGSFFYGARYLDGQPLFWLMIGLGMGLVMSAAVIAGLSGRRASEAAERRSWIYIVVWHVVILASMGLYLGYRAAIGQAAAPETHLGRVLLAAYLGSFVLGTMFGLGVEWAFQANGRGRLAEPARVARSGRAWAIAGLTLGVIVCLNYVAVRKDRSWDWSYLKTSKPSESTAKILGSLDKELRIGLFFASTNEVQSHVRSYFDALPLKDAHVKVEYFDAEINPVSAESFKASRNGQIVLKYGDTSERLDIGTTLAAARKMLRNLDAEFQKTLLATTEKRKILYFTRGHGELGWTGSDDDSMRTIKLLEGFLRQQNYTLRFFGVGEGSTKQVPDDADAVVVAGGNAPMLAEEAQAIRDYVLKGGKLFALLDLDPPADTVVSKASRDADHDPFVKMLADMGVRYAPVPLANASNFVAATRSDADAWFLFTNVFTSHDSTTALARSDQRAAVMTFRSGYLTVTSELAGWQNFETVRSLSDTFVDEDRDFKFSEGKEKRNPWVMGAASLRKEASTDGKQGRVLTFSDASAISDVLIRNQGNLIYFVEGLRWLVGDAKASAGVASSEEDVRIRHTRKEDMAWFYGTVLAVPGLILGLGFLATRRARRK